MDNSSQIIYGIHGLIEALEARHPLEKIWIKRENSQHDRIKEIRQKANEQAVPIQYVPEIKLQKLCGHSDHQGVVARGASVIYHELEDLILAVKDKDKTACFVMLDSVTDVRNFGAISRTASCMEVDGLIVPHIGSAAVNAAAIKSSAGALHHVAICRVPQLVDAILMLQSYDILPIACTEKGEADIYETDFNQDICLILGSEEKGISPRLQKRLSTHVKIPISGPIASLNVSVAAGIIMAEVQRQRKLGN